MSEPSSSASIEGLRELHSLHQRAKTLRDLMVSGPKTLASREAILASRKTTLEAAHKATKETKAQTKNKEVQVQSLQTKIEDLKVKRNTVRKQDEYNALSNQIQTDQRAMERLEVEILEGMEKADEQSAAAHALDVEIKKLTSEVATMRDALASRAESQKDQLKELETAITAAEELIPADQREQYRRNVKQRGPDALASADDGACSGCFVAITPQMMNELINGRHMVFCYTCGRVLYLAERDQPNTRRAER
jgi:predicted  nucleic acid-binding Zn-ribbon protein